MPLTEDEEFELLSLEREKALSNSSPDMRTGQGGYSSEKEAKTAQFLSGINQKIAETQVAHPYASAAIDSLLKLVGTPARVTSQLATDLGNNADTKTKLEHGLQALLAQKESSWITPTNMLGIKGVPGTVVGIAADIATSPGGPQAIGGLSKLTYNTGKNVLKGTGEVLQNTFKNDKLAGNVINSLIKPSHKEYMFGKNPGLSVAKEGIVAGNLDELASKVEERIIKLDEASKLIRNSPENMHKTIDLNNIKKPLIDSYLKLSKAPNVNSNQMNDIRKALMDIRNLNEGNLSNVSISDAYDIKKVISQMQNWSIENKSGVDINKSLRSVYHLVDSHIDKAIPELQQINSRMANLISAKKAIINRVEVVSKQEPGPTINKILDLPFVAMKTPRAKTILGKLLAKRYSSFTK